MRFRHPDGSLIHLSYCTRAHPAQDFDDVVRQLSRFAEPVRKKLDVPLLGVSLWLAAPVARTLANDEAALAVLQEELVLRGLEVVTLNGFTYEDLPGHGAPNTAYRPDWAEPERLQYTLDLVAILHRLLPSDAEGGSITTLPLGWRERDLMTAPAALQTLASSLRSLHQEHGRPVRVALQPEPGCLIETIAQANNVFELVRSPHIGLGLDTCHAAVQFEDVFDSLLDLSARLVKAQLSSALRMPPGTDKVWIREFVNPDSLHQTRSSDGANVIRGVDDLSQVDDLDPSLEWRTHFHVPVNVAENTTQFELMSALGTLVGDVHPLTTHLELKTYNWGVLPGTNEPEDDDQLVVAIATELAWVREQLRTLGLAEVR